MKKRPSISLLTSLALALLLVACSVDSSSNDGHTISRKAALQAMSEFVLLNERGQAAPPVEWTQGKSPFGILLRWDFRGLAQCNVSQVAPGYVATNAHCYSREANAIHQIIFYDRSGKLTRTAPISEVKVGKESYDDVALLEVAAAVVAGWDSVASSLKEFLEISRKSEEVRESENVVIWTMDPVESGAVFAPRQCVATQVMPRLGYEVNGSVVEDSEYRPITKTLSTLMHLYMSGCAKPPVLGNSGALVTSVDFIPRGVFHWELPRSHIKGADVFLSAEGSWERIADAYPDEADPSIFQFGSRFFPFLGSLKI